MSQIEVFNNEEFGSIRVIEENGKYLFCGLDAAKALGYKDTVNDLKAHCSKDGVAFYHLTDNLGRKQKVKFISEGNLYRLIVYSKLPSRNGLRDGCSTRCCLLSASTEPM